MLHYAVEQTTTFKWTWPDDEKDKDKVMQHREDHLAICASLIQEKALRNWPLMAWKVKLTSQRGDPQIKVTATVRGDNARDARQRYDYYSRRLFEIPLPGAQALKSRRMTRPKLVRLEMPWGTPKLKEIKA